MKHSDERSEAHFRILARQFSTYIVVGIVNTLLTYALYLGLFALVSYPIAFTVSYSVGVLISYFANSRLSFRSQYSWLRMARYAFIQVTLYLLSLGGLIIMVEHFYISSWLAPLLVAGTIAMLGFILGRLAVR